MRPSIHDLRSTFNRAAREYDALRPGYPPALIDDIHALGGFTTPGQALEVGCGTGQATLPFARRGWRITCLDIGAEMLAVAAENLRAYPAVTFQQVSFEDWPLRLGGCDLLYSATAFHWVPREIGYAKAALALRSGGALAIFTNLHPRPFTGFFEEVTPIYQRIVPEWDDPAEQPTTQQAIDDQTAFMRRTGLYASVTARAYPWSRTYTTQDYLRLLGTYSNHLSLPHERRAALFEAIAALIDTRYAGRVERPYLAVLHLAVK